MRSKRKIINHAFLLILMAISLPSLVLAQVQLRDIRHGEHSGYDRIVFDFSGPVYYRVITQAEDRKLYLEFHDCQADYFTNGHTQYINDRILRTFRVNKQAGNIISVRLDVVPEFEYRVFKMNRPWRLVIDISKKKTATAPSQAKPEKQPETKPLPPAASVTEQEPEVRKPEEPTVQYASQVIQPYQSTEFDSTLLQLKKQAKPMAAEDSVQDNEQSSILLPSFSTNNQQFFKIIMLTALILNCIVFIVYIAFFRKKKRVKKSKTKTEATAQTEIELEMTEAEEEELERNFQALINEHMETLEDKAPVREKEPVEPVFEPPVEMPAPKIEIRSGNRAISEYAQFQKPQPPPPIAQPQRNVRRSAVQLNEQVEELLQANFDIKSIARALNLGQDEVQMIINLQKRRNSVKPKKEEKTYSGFSFAY